MTRYVGTGTGEWRGDWYRYVPSNGDRVLVREISEEVQARAAAVWRRSGYGPVRESRPEWIARGIFGEVAALHPIGSGPDRVAWAGRRRYARSSDFGPLEIRTTTRRALRGGSDRYPALGGWIVTAKDHGRIIVCVQDRDEDLVVMGWQRADDAIRLASPIGGVLAVIYPDELRVLEDLAPYAEASKR